MDLTACGGILLVLKIRKVIKCSITALPLERQVKRATIGSALYDPG